MPPSGSAASLPCEQFQQFEGPLELLLDEVRRQNVEIEKIAMAPMVARFLAYVGSAATRNLNLDIDWLHMAATLIHWKSRSLLPKEAVANCDPDRIRDSLVQQLLAHRRQAAEELDLRWALARGRLSRSAGVLAEETNELPEPPGLTVWDMLQQARELMRWVGQHREERRLWQKFAVEQDDDVTLSEMMEYLRMKLSVGGSAEVDGTRLLREQATTSRQACLFLGMLEMAREQVLELDQTEPFGPLLLSLR
jgi:segregation and condensation protein A